MRLNPLIFNKNTNGAINLLQAFKSNVKKKKKQNKTNSQSYKEQKMTLAKGP